jgi:NAD(P)-dependent dehydrogenase (short-subunit alcohol dehydrogenase family)
MSQPTIIITGASQGLGAAMAAIAAEQGAQVVLAARSESLLEMQAEQIRQRGGTALAVAGDVGRADDCRRIVERTLEAFGTIDALVNNAATVEPLDAITDIGPAAWSRHLAVNLLGPIMLCQLAIPHLRQAQGRVVNVTSHGADLAIPGTSAYATSKAALNRFSRVLAAEEPAITVILFIPGEVDTAMQAVIRAQARGKTPDEIYQFFVDLHEQGQLLPPETPAEAAVTLALHAPPEWSGEILEWDDERVQEFVKAQGRPHRPDKDIHP